jgi:nucleoid-associated protein YgaU
VDVAAANNIANPDYILVGQKITVPTVQPKQATVGDITAQAAMTKAESSISPTHTVAQGEYLWLIAQKEYNNPYNWTRIAQLNPTISNPDYILPGQILKLK